MRTQHATARQSGFSLIELLVVVGLIVVVAAISIPNLAQYVRNYRLKGGADEVMGELQRARRLAVMKNVNWGVLFVVETANTYRYVNQDLQLTTHATLTKARPLTLSEAASSAELKKAQVGPIHFLPQGIVFGSSSCGVTPTGSTVRFNRFGMACKPEGAATAPCPAVSGAPTQQALEFDYNGVNGQMAICVEDPRRGLWRRLVMSPGGRVRVEMAE